MSGIVAGSEAARDQGTLPGTRLLVSWVVLSAAAIVLLGLWQGEAYWEYSDGVYAQSARQLLDGQSLYRDFAAAQPPPLYYLAAGVLAISDSPAAIRLAMALCQACASLLVVLAVKRLTRSHAAALCAGFACFVTPWALREHAQLIPELFAAPLVLAAALCGGSRRGSAAAGALAASAVAFKLAFVLPALAIVLVSRSVRRAFYGFVVVGALLGVGSLAAFGEPLWTNTVHAQAQTGYASARYVAGLWAQAGWNLLPLLLLAGLVWPHRRSLPDPDLARRLLAASLGSLLLLASMLKHGSYLTVVLVAEAPLLCLAACGVVMTLRGRGRVAGTAVTRRSVAPLVVAAAAFVLAIAQVASLLVSPANPALFERPLAASGPARVLSSAEVERMAAQIRTCPAETTYPGPPYLAFVAGRDVSGSQPDQFIIRHAPVHESFRRAADGDPAICHAAPVPRSR